MNNTKQVLPALEGGSAAEDYLFAVRKEAKELESVFYTAKRVPKSRIEAEPKVGDAPEQTVNLYLVHKKCSQIFEKLPSRCPDPQQFYELSVKQVAKVEPPECKVDGKEAWKTFINSHEPQRLTHKQVFDALKVLAKMPLNDQTQWWSWCLLLQIQSPVTANELALMRSINDPLWKSVLASCFGQADLSAKRQRLDY